MLYSDHFLRVKSVFLCVCKPDATSLTLASLEFCLLHIYFFLEEEEKSLFFLIFLIICYLEPMFLPPLLSVLITATGYHIVHQAF